VYHRLLGAAAPGETMPASSLLALIDDIATVLDDVALLTKVATKKTAGVLGDDLALNAQQVAGVRAHRELPVVWAVAKGSLVNKAILVPAALAISALAPWAVTPLLMIGGAFLCFEGVEKLAHKLLHSAAEERAHQAELLNAVIDPTVDFVRLEKDKIKGAVRTDFILSAEIVTIALGTIATQPFMTRVAVLVSIAALMTVGVYGLVAGIVKLDDLGLYLTRERASGVGRGIGAAILMTAPYLMKGLSIAGTVAMFLVGGGILTHGVPFLHDLSHHAAEAARSVRVVGSALAAAIPLVMDIVVGVAAGVVVLLCVIAAKRLIRTRKPAQTGG
jgi:predicted DNA repair protein MutK